MLERHALLHALHLALERELLRGVPVQLPHRRLALRLLGAALLVHLVRVGVAVGVGVGVRVRVRVGVRVRVRARVRPFLCTLR